MAEPTLTIFSVVPPFDTSTTPELSLTYVKVPLLFDVGDGTYGVSRIVLLIFERPLIVGVPRSTVSTAEMSWVL